MEQSPTRKANRSSSPSPHFTQPEFSLPHSQKLTNCRCPQNLPLSYQMNGLNLTVCKTVCGMGIFYGKELLAPRPTPKLEDHPLSSVRNCSFNISAATFHNGGPCSIRNLRTRHAVVTGNPLIMV